MRNLQGEPEMVTGGSQGLGLGVVEALIARGARVTVLARDRVRLAEVEEHLGVPVRPGDSTDAALMDAVVAEVSPSVLILNAGAKRVLWLMAHCANSVANERRLGIRFQALAPLQLIGETALGQQVAEAYAHREGVSTEAYLAARFGEQRLSPRQYGEQVVTLLTDPRHATGVAYGFSDTGITPLDA